LPPGKDGFDTKRRAKWLLDAAVVLNSDQRLLQFLNLHLVKLSVEVLASSSLLVLKTISAPASVVRLRIHNCSNKFNSLASVRSNRYSNPVHRYLQLLLRPRTMTLPHPPLLVERGRRLRMSKYNLQSASEHELKLLRHAGHLRDPARMFFSLSLLVVTHRSHHQHPHSLFLLNALPLT
jgi:hypothetical protein